MKANLVLKLATIHFTFNVVDVFQLFPNIVEIHKWCGQVVICTDRTEPDSTGILYYLEYV